MSDNTTNYESIVSLTGLQGIRSKLSMYLGGTHSIDGKQPRALTQMLQEVMSNSLDEAVAGYGDIIRIERTADNVVTVFDKGRGVPFKPRDCDPLIRAFTVPHSSGKFDDKAYSALGIAGTHGIGVKAVNAASETMTVYSKRRKHIAAALFERGELTDMTVFNIEKDIDELEQIADIDALDWLSNADSGTVISYKPDTGPISDANDRKVLDTDVMTRDSVQQICTAAAFLTPGLTVQFADKADSDERDYTYCYPDGVRDYLANTLNCDISNVYSCEIDSIDIPVSAGKCVAGYKLALTIASVRHSLKSFVNGVYTPNGTHVTALRNGISKGFRTACPNVDCSLDDIMNSLAIMYHAQVPGSIVEFEGQTKDILATSQIRKPFIDSIAQQVTAMLYDNDKLRNELVKYVKASVKERKELEQLKEAAKTAKKATRKSKLALSSKLKAAQSRKPAERELYLVEGDSASNIGRDVRTQAVFPLRGKIINAMKADMTRLLKNTEVTTLINALGAGFLDEFDVSKLQYHKVIAACFTGETRVRFSDGSTATMAEMVNSESHVCFNKQRERKRIFTYTDNKAVVLTDDYTAQVTGYVDQLVKLEFSTGETVTCTPDHLFMLSHDSSLPASSSNIAASVHYKPAELLTTSDELATMQITNSKTVTVVNKQFITLAKPEPVYCLTVEGAHNFMLANGVFVHNCDQDVDGWHIRSLLAGLCYKLFPGLIESGHFYVVDSPLYKATRYVKGKPEHKMLYSEAEMDAMRSELDGYDITRFKGLGEMNESEAREALADPSTRRLTQLTVEDAETALEVLERTIGDDIAGRRSWVASELSKL